ncbi:hypothetical protein AMST5_00115 [freshwater sediment metagenome]|uniref:Uncharacterized protein n=1 Tax=freshwater sediment metagenome TaxID=556182 RepID=A0AA48LXY8_9ZZZZ
MRFKIIVFGTILLAAVSTSAHADDIPGDCMVSFKVDATKFSTDINWATATGSSATISCAAGELLRENLFVQGDSRLSEADLKGTASAAQQKAIDAYKDMQAKIEKLPGDDVSGATFKALLYLVAKYQLASCILTVEAEGGTCWSFAAKFLGSSGAFALKVYQNQSNVVSKNDLLNTLKGLKPPTTAGSTDSANARLRWVRTQTALCRAIQQDCL